MTLPAGTDVTPAIWLTHTRPDVYPEPFAFKPERFLEDGPDTYAWIPFGGSVRRCIGATFAEFEMRVVLREVLTRCELRKAEPARPSAPAAATSPSRRRTARRWSSPRARPAREPVASLTTHFAGFCLHSSPWRHFWRRRGRGELERRAAGRTEPADG